MVSDKLEEKSPKPLWNDVEEHKTKSFLKRKVWEKADELARSAATGHICPFCPISSKSAWSNEYYRACHETTLEKCGLCIYQKTFTFRNLGMEKYYKGYCRAIIPVFSRPKTW